MKDREAAREAARKGTGKESTKDVAQEAVSCSGGVNTIIL